MALAGESREAGVPVMVAQFYRFIRREVVLRRLLAEGVVGRPLRVTVASTLIRQPYLRSPEDVLWHFGIHHWDAFRTRFGGPPHSIHVRPLPEVSAGTSFGASLVWEGGPEVSYLHHDGTDPMGYHEWVGCETGSLVVVAERVFVDRRGRRLRRVWRPRRVDAERPFLRGLEAAAAGRPPEDLGIQDNLQTIAMIEAARRSIASGEPVRVEDVLAEEDGGGPGA
jgi:predicted dehydrogenase